MMKRIAVLLAIGVAVAAALRAQTSIRTAGDIETDGQLKSNAAMGTSPLTVTSTTVVPNLNADLLDGNNSADFAGASETAVELTALRASAIAAASARTSCRAGMSRVGAWCMDDGWSTAANGTDSTMACHRQAKSLCPLEAIKTCDFLDLRKDASFPDSCGSRTDGASGDVIRTLTYDHHTGLDPFDTVGYKDDNTLESQTGADVRRYYCCTPAPLVRFEDMGDGTVRDNNTGLYWLKDATCAALAGTDATGRAVWETARTAAAALVDGTCGLTDGSSAGDWRLPTIGELCSRGEVSGICPVSAAASSLLNTSFSSPSLSNIAGDGPCDGTVTDCAFSDVMADQVGYWSSSPVANNASNAWGTNLTNGFVAMILKVAIGHVWPVRGGP